MFLFEYFFFTYLEIILNSFCYDNENYFYSNKPPTTDNLIIFIRR